MRYFIQYALIFTLFTIPALGMNKKPYIFTAFRGEPAVQELLLHEFEIRRVADQMMHSSNMVSGEVQRLAQLDFIIRHINVIGLPVRAAFEKWADKNTFNPNNANSVAQAVQAAINFNKIGWAQAYLEDRLGSGIYIDSTL